MKQRDLVKALPNGKGNKLTNEAGTKVASKKGKKKIAPLLISTSKKAEIKHLKIIHAERKLTEKQLKNALEKFKSDVKRLSELKDNSLGEPCDNNIDI